MLDTSEIIMFAALGALFAVGLAVLSRGSQAGLARLAAYALIAVACLYVGFAVRAENAAAWVGFEMTGVALFGSLAGVSIIRFPWLVVLGLAAHPLWAYYFHYLGGGQAFAPAPMVVTTMGFDIAAALFVAISLWRERGKTPASAPAPEKRPAARSQHRSRGAGK